MPSAVVSLLSLSLAYFPGLQVRDAGGGAPYPLTFDPIVQEAYLKASNTGVQDFFGLAVAVSGDTLVVGAPQEDGSARGVNGDPNDEGAPDSGAAYVFTRDAAGWSFQAYLKASNTGAGDGFGSAVSVSGDTLVVGAFGEDSAATGVNGDESSDGAPSSGAVYVFARSGTNWSQQAYLKASNAQAGDEFGRSVAISGNTVVVGAQGEDADATGVNGDGTNDGAPGSGAAYVFVRNASTWSQQAYVKASNTDAGDRFGHAVSVSGDTLVVGADFEDGGSTGVDGDASDDGASASGAAYVFVRNGASWSQQAYVKASNTDAQDLFGSSVSLSGDTLVVGALAEDSSATGVDGDDGDDGAAFSGAAYVFRRSGTTWSQEAYLKASNTGANDLFGGSVSVSGDALVVGATQEDGNATGIDGDGSNNAVPQAGAAYLFVREAAVWSQAAYIKASNTAYEDFFGVAVSVAAGTLVVGAYGEDSQATGVDGDEGNNGATDSGAAYVFATDALDGPGAPICFGDGSGAPCGCGNTGPSGAGCANSLGVGALLSASGSASLAADDLVLIAAAVTNRPGLFFQGDAAIAGGQGTTFGDGIRCCGQGVVRLQVVDPPGPTRPTTASTSVSIAHHAPPGTVSAGDTKCYQYWYRDPAASPCGANFNLSNALLVTWTM